MAASALRLALLGAAQAAAAGRVHRHRPGPLYIEHYQRLLGYEPKLVKLRAPAGCAVRRINIHIKAATRTEWLHRKNYPTRALQLALAGARKAGSKVAVVTFKALVSWVHTQAQDVEVGHYRALRGLDHWKGYDALITLGDPRMNLDAALRAELDVDGLACAELEQAHGRLRIIHRTKACTMIHIGALLPAGWEAPIETMKPPRGRPRRAAVDLDWLRAAVDVFGGQRAVGRLLGVSHVTVSKWLRAKATPSDEHLEKLRCGLREAA